MTHNKEKPVSTIHLLDYTINEIIGGINAKELVLFCGAGISRISGLPIVKEFVPYLLSLFNIPDRDTQLLLDNDNYPKIPFELFMEIILENSKTDSVLNVYNLGNPNTSHILLAKLLIKNNLKTIVTTNFDSLIEKALKAEGFKDFDVIYTEADFDNIQWQEDRVRIIKIHGSAHDKEAMNSMSVTLKQIANQDLSLSRKSIIDHIFSNGNHKSVLILGYSSSDIFDITPQIEAISRGRKKVYYIQHSEIRKVEDIRIQIDKNPFKEFKGSVRLYYNTDTFIETLFNKTIEDEYQYITSEADWGHIVEDWYDKIINEYKESIKYFIPGVIFLNISEYSTAIKYFEKALEIKVNDRSIKDDCLGNLGTAYAEQGEYEKAISFYKEVIGEKLLQLLITKKLNLVNLPIIDLKGKGATLANIGNVYASQRKYKNAIQYYELSIEVSRYISNEKGLASSLMCLGNSYAGLAKYVEAKGYINQAMHIAKKNGDKKSEAGCLGNLGIIHISEGKIDEAITLFRRAETIFKYIGDKSRKAIWSNNLETANRYLGRYNEATENYNYALETVRQAENKQKGGGLLDKNAYEAAIKHYSKALEIAKEIGIDYIEEACLGNLGDVYLRLGRYEEATKIYLMALRSAKKTGNENGKAGWFENFIIAFESTKKSNESMEYFNQAIKIAETIENKIVRGKIYIIIGDIFERQGEHQLALDYFIEAKELAGQNKDRQVEGILLDIIGNTYEKTGKYDEALRCHHEALNIISREYGNNHPNTEKVKANLYRTKEKMIQEKNRKSCR